MAIQQLALLVLLLFAGELVGHAEDILTDYIICTLENSRAAISSASSFAVNWGTCWTCWRDSKWLYDLHKREFMQQLTLPVLLQGKICCKMILYCANHIYLYILIQWNVENSSSTSKFHVFYYNNLRNLFMFLSTAILQESCCICAEGCSEAFSSAGTGMKESKIETFLSYHTKCVYIPTSVHVYRFQVMC